MIVYLGMSEQVRNSSTCQIGSVGRTFECLQFCANDQNTFNKKYKYYMHRWLGFLFCTSLHGYWLIRRFVYFLATQKNFTAFLLVTINL